MIKADLPIMEALMLARRQATKPGLIKVTKTIIDDLNRPSPPSLTSVPHPGRSCDRTRPSPTRGKSPRCPPCWRWRSGCWETPGSGSLAGPTPKEPPCTRCSPASPLPANSPPPAAPQDQPGQRAVGREYGGPGHHPY